MDLLLLNKYDGEKLNVFLDQDNDLGMFALMLAWRQLVAGQCNLTQFFRRLLVRLDQRFGERQVTSFSPRTPSPSLFLDTDSDNEPYESRSPLHLPMNPLLAGALAHQANGVGGGDPLSSSSNDMLTHFPSFAALEMMAMRDEQYEEEQGTDVQFDALMKGIEVQMKGTSKKKGLKEADEKKKDSEETKEKRRRSPSERKQTVDDHEDGNEMHVSKKSRLSSNKKMSRSGSKGNLKQQNSTADIDDNENIAEFNDSDSESNDNDTVVVNDDEKLLRLLTRPFVHLSKDGSVSSAESPRVPATEEPQTHDSHEVRRVRASQQQSQLSKMNSNSEYYLDRAWDHRRVLLLDMAMLVKPVRRVGRRRANQRNAIHSVEQAASLLGITQGVATWQKLRAVGEMLVECQEFNTVMRERIIQRPSVSKLKVLFTVERFRTILPQLLVKWKQLIG